jgi:anti-sigma factor (TIGR02949 family)
MDCTSVRERLHDLVRGRAEAQDAADLRAHLAGCAACRHEEQAERLLDQALDERLPRYAAPEALRERISAQLRGARPRSAGPQTPRRGLPAQWGLAAAAIALAALGYVAGQTIPVRSGAGERLADEVVTDHLRALASTHPHDVESSSSHEVKPWFEGRIDFAPVVPADRGELRLLGGSIGYVGDRKAAVISYGLRHHRLTLLAFPRAGLPGFEHAPQAGPPRRIDRRGFEVAWWAAGDVGYALVGDVGGEELVQLATELAADTRR